MMKKKGDTKKHFREEKIDSLIGKILSRVLILTFLITNDFSAQTVLNNFGVSEYIKTQPHFTKFTQIDFNNDSFKDLFLFGNKEKSFVLHRGLEDSTFAEPIRKFFFYPIDDFKWFTKAANGSDYYLFTSRNRRLIGLVSFTSTNSLELLHTIKFDSYPSSIEIVDINNDGKNEALIFGSNFNGLVIIRNEGYRLQAETMYENSLFNDVLSVDFNQDELGDFIALDVLTNSLKFLENIEGDRLALNREIEKEENIYCLKQADFNNDGFLDIGIGTETGIQFMEGDSVFSYSAGYLFNNNFPVENFLFADLNSDQIGDLSIINRTENKLEIHLNQNMQPYSFLLNGISDVSFNKNKKNNVLLLLSEEGVIQQISKRNKFGKNFYFSVGGGVDEVDFISYNPDSIKIIFNNPVDNTIGIMKQLSDGTISEVDNFQALNSFTRFRYLDDLKTFLCYTENSRLLEIFYVKSQTEEIVRNFFYTEDPIKQIVRDLENDIRISEYDGSRLTYTMLPNTSGRYSSMESILVDTSVVASFINNAGDFYYWTKDSLEFTLNRFNKYERKTLLKVDYENSDYFPPVFVEEVDKNIDIAMTFIKKQKGIIALRIDGDIITEYKIGKKLKANLFTTRNKVFKDSKNIVKLYSYNNQSKTVFISVMNDNSKELNLSKNIEGIEANDYFVTNLFKQRYLIYSDVGHNSIRYKIIK